MTVKEQLRQDSGMLDEMARKELLLVVKKLKDGDIAGAASDYIDAGGSTSSSGVSRTVNAYINKELPEEPLKKNLEDFKTAVTNAAAEKGIESKRPVTYKKNVATGKTKTGEVVTAPKGQGQQSQSKRIEEKLVKVQVEHAKQIRTLESGDLAKEQSVAFDMMNTWGIPKKGEVDEVYEFLKKFAQEGLEREKAVKVMKKILDEGKEALDVIRKSALVSLAGKVMLPKKEVEESITYKEYALMESFGYKGYLFWENYILSHMVRTVAMDLQEMEEEDVIEIYTEIYGDDIKPILEHMIDNQEALEEAAKIKGLLLFEEVGKKNIEQHYLTEALPSLANLKLGRLMGRGAAVSQAGKSAFSARVASQIGPGTAGKVGFLAGLWNKVKEFGKGIFGKIKPFLQKGVAWAKELVQKGAAWFAANPIAKVVIPAIALVGTAIGAKKLINKIREKRGKKKMSAAEEKKFDEIAAKQKAA